MPPTKPERHAEAVNPPRAIPFRWWNDQLLRRTEGEAVARSLAPEGIATWTPT
jgi:hypothetical protein